MPPTHVQAARPHHLDAIGAEEDGLPLERRGDAARADLVPRLGLVERWVAELELEQRLLEERRQRKH
jgi:hypothetical protein